MAIIGACKPGRIEDVDESAGVHDGWRGLIGAVLVQALKEYASDGDPEAALDAAFWLVLGDGPLVALAVGVNLARYYELVLRRKISPARLDRGLYQRKRR